MKRSITMQINMFNPQPQPQEPVTGIYNPKCSCSMCNMPLGTDKKFYTRSSPIAEYTYPLKEGTAMYIRALGGYDRLKGQEYLCYVWGMGLDTPYYIWACHLT